MSLMMQVEQWPLANLKEYANNPRKNDHAVDAVVKAIKAYGFKVPILVRSNGEIIDGHLRYKAAVKAGLQDVPVLIADDLSEDEVKAFRISVNKVAELATWDIKLLEVELQQLDLSGVDLSLIGFTEVELESYLSPQPKGLVGDDEVPDPDAYIAQPGDLWILGDHRLYVGDSRSKESYKMLLAGDKVDMVWTDPPYNVDYSSKAGKIKNDKMSEEAFVAFLKNFFAVVADNMRPGAPIYVAHDDGKSSMAFRKGFADAGFHLSACLVWRKNMAVISRSDYHFQHEPILYGWKPGGPHSWYGGRKRKSIIDLCDGSLFNKISKDTFHIQVGAETLVITGQDVSVSSIMPSIISIDKPRSSDLHPTMKPVALVEHCLINSSVHGDIVFDGFGGSGTTLIACEKCDRKARIIELDEKFADVIITRWEKYTGRDAVRADGRKYKDINPLYVETCNCKNESINSLKLSQKEIV